MTAKEIIRYCREKIAAYKVPKAVAFIDGMPKTAIGKMTRLEVREIDRTQTEDSE